MKIKKIALSIYEYNIDIDIYHTNGNILYCKYPYNNKTGIIEYLSYNSEKHYFKFINNTLSVFDIDIPINSDFSFVKIDIKLSISDIVLFFDDKPVYKYNFITVNKEYIALHILEINKVVEYEYNINIYRDLKYINNNIKKIKKNKIKIKE